MIKKIIIRNTKVMHFIIKIKNHQMKLLILAIKNKIQMKMLQYFQ